MSIDWNTAPEGANKAGFIGHEYLQFYRIPGMFGDYDYWDEIMGTWCGSDFPTCANHLFDRPEKVEWDGQGLPPVGTLCEWHGPNSDGPDGWVYTESNVVAYTDDGLFICMQKPGCWPVVQRIDNCEFRPLRTPEQIAAEEREKAIEEMCFAVETLTVKQAKALFDAGYRRQEEGK